MRSGAEEEGEKVECWCRLHRPNESSLNLLMALAARKAAEASGSDVAPAEPPCPRRSLARGYSFLGRAGSRLADP